MAFLIVFTLVVPISADIQADYGLDAIAYLDIQPLDLNLSEIFNIPFFVVEAGELEDAHINWINEIVQEVASSRTIISTQSLGEHLLTSRSYEAFELHGIELLSTEAILDLENHPIYANTLNRIQQLLNDGTTVNYVTFFVPSMDFMDASYFNSNSRSNGGWGQHWWTMNGFAINRFDGPVINIRSPWMENTHRNLNWSQLGGATLELAFDVLSFPPVIGGVSRVIGWAGSARSFAGFIDAPFQMAVTSPGYRLEHMISGDLIQRAVLIEDRNNISSNPFVLIGELEQFWAERHLSTQQPVMRGSVVGTQTVFSSNVNPVIFSTPNYIGNITFFDQMVRNYNNGARTIYHESLNTRQIALRLIP